MCCLLAIDRRRNDCGQLSVCRSFSHSVSETDLVSAEQAHLFNAFDIVLEAGEIVQIFICDHLSS